MRFLPSPRPPAHPTGGHDQHQVVRGDAVGMQMGRDLLQFIAGFVHHAGLRGW
jgi:hypothetical protein